MKPIVVTAFFLLISSGTLHAQQKAPADLQACLDEIRASGMSENGRGAVGMIASICAGATLLDYQVDKSSGRYWPSYMSATCPKPDADPPQIEQWKKLRRSDADLLVDKLKPFADADASGFVSSTEGAEFRSLVEFGYLVAQVNKNEGTTSALIARASGYNVQDAEARVLAYNTLARRVRESGVTELPDAKMTE